jgi:5'-3' exonuclease
MIIVDYSQFAIASVLSQLKFEKELSEDLVRHILLNSIRDKRAKFHSKYGELVFAMDSGNPWRKDHFPEYKANRKKARDSSDLDWKEIYRILDDINTEFIETLPYKFIKVPHAEGDDIIATLCKISDEPTLILSSDKDFLQMQKLPNIKQYDPFRDRWLKTDDPSKFLMEHIIRGDSGDGVPNYLSGNRFLVDGIKQKSIMQKKLDVWLTMSEDEFLRNIEKDQKANYLRNKKMIDLDQIPDDIHDQIVAQFAEPPKGSRSKIMNYFIKNRMKILMEYLQDF